MSALRVRSIGPLATLQDGGRTGWLRFGVPGSGALDPRALAIANLLVGNRHAEGALELTLAGGEFVLEGARRIALAGADMPLTIDGIACASGQSHGVAAGSVLRIGAARAGARAYLAVGGGFAAAPVFGSVATHLRSGIGGFTGRALAAGDVLPLGDAARDGPELRLAAPPPPSYPRIRVVLGPQRESFTAAAIETLLAAEYRVSARSDRMGCRLEGPLLAHRGDFNIISDGVAPGSIQVPGGGAPIVLLSDRQTTGGYPKIATVISADLPRFGQMRPGDLVRFEAVDLDRAVAARRELLAWLEALPAALAPVGAFDSESLLRTNLISGVSGGEG
jgi:5-oxoprolinase (ATP-hydrolysing) subunit C